ncbi:MAG TPA: archease [Candidatus Polarisedimenticolaceae bacterium]|nr:archease [Candidatus Polarisedimenticolaceae bacterium]
MFELVEHTADVGIRVTAGDLDTLFRDAAEGLLSLIVEPGAGSPGAELRFDLEGNRLDHLLFDWLNELLYTCDVRRLVLENVEVKLAGTTLAGRARGRPIDPARDRLGREVKAITYHRLKVEPTETGWLAEFIVDI